MLLRIEDICGLRGVVFHFVPLTLASKQQTIQNRRQNVPGKRKQNDRDVSFWRSQNQLCHIRWNLQFRLLTLRTRQESKSKKIKVLSSLLTSQSVIIY